MYKDTKIYFRNEQAKFSDHLILNGNTSKYDVSIPLSDCSGTTDTSLSLNSLSLTSVLPPTDPDHHNPHSTHSTHNMNKLCRQVSIESPGPGAKNCVFNFFVPIEDTPALGARIRIVCAGACYRRRDRANSITSMSSVSSELSDYCPSVNSMSSPAHQGIREAPSFPASRWPASSSPWARRSPRPTTVACALDSA